jgi:hypothetical protein
LGSDRQPVQDHLPWNWAEAPPVGADVEASWMLRGLVPVIVSMDHHGRLEGLCDPELGGTPLEIRCLVNDQDLGLRHPNMVNNINETAFHEELVVGVMVATDKPLPAIQHLHDANHQLAVRPTGGNHVTDNGHLVIYLDASVPPCDELGVHLIQVFERACR